MPHGTALSPLTVVLAIVFTTGCGGAAAAAQTPPPATANVSAGWLVWSATGEGGERTSWLDASGRELASREGIVIAHDRSLHRVVIEREQVRLPTCEQLEQALAPLGERAVLARASLVELGGTDRTTLVPPVEAAGVASLEQQLEVVASLGPYVFVRSTAASFACGAHGSVDVALHAIDLEAGEPIESASARDDAHLEALGARAHEQLIAESEGMLDEPLGQDAVRHVASLPVLADGRVVVDHVFVTDACYACSDPDWSSYTRATTVRDREVPAHLAPHARFPEGVARRLAATPTARGVSVVPAAEAAHLLELFRDAAPDQSASAIDPATRTSSDASTAAEPPFRPPTSRTGPIRTTGLQIFTGRSLRRSSRSRSSSSGASAPIVAATLRARARSAGAQLRRMTRPMSATSW